MVSTKLWIHDGQIVPRKDKTTKNKKIKSSVSEIVDLFSEQPCSKLDTVSHGSLHLIPYMVNFITNKFLRTEPAEMLHDRVLLYEPIVFPS